MVFKKINISLFQPSYSVMNIHNAFLEVIESLQWGFTNLGFECTFRINEVDRTCVNIAFGWVAAFNSGHMDIYPPGTILYNLEQWSNTRLYDQPVFHHIAEKFQIWDYSLGNLARWNELNPKYTPYYARISFAPNLIKIQPAEEDIDILFIGQLNHGRADKVAACQSNVGLNRNSVVSVSNVWGRQRDDFISRAKLMLNLSSPTGVFEIVRVSYYLANKKAVVCEYHPNLVVEDDISEIVKFVATSDMASYCDSLVHDAEKRKNYAEKCFDFFCQRDVRDVIRNFFM